MNSFRKLNRLPVPTTQPTTDPTSGAVPCRSLQEDRYSLCSHIFSWKPSGHRIRQYIECSLCWFRRRGRRHNFMIRASPFPPVMPCHARRVKDDNDGLGPVSSSIRPATRCHSSRLRERERAEKSRRFCGWWATLQVKALQKLSLFSVVALSHLLFPRRV